MSEADLRAENARLRRELADREDFLGATPPKVEVHLVPHPDLYTLPT